MIVGCTNIFFTIFQTFLSGFDQEVNQNAELNSSKENRQAETLQQENTSRDR